MLPLTGCAAATSTEFYQINQKVPIPKLETADADLLASGVKALMLSSRKTTRR